MVTSFSGKYKPDEGDDFLLIMKKTVKRIESILKNSDLCEFIAVTIPEYMAIMETDQLIKSLGKYGIKVKQLIINNVMESEDCSFCRQRKEAQKKYIKQILEKFDTLQITEIPLQPEEVKGLDAIHNFKNLLFKWNIYSSYGVGKSLADIEQANLLPNSNSYWMRFIVLNYG